MALERFLDSAKIKLARVSLLVLNPWAKSACPAIDRGEGGSLTKTIELKTV